MADPASGGTGGVLALQYNIQSGNIQMRVSNDPVQLASQSWVPLQSEIPWTLANGPAGEYIVYAQFKDGAGNESYVVYDTIDYVPNIYIPIIRR
jgi:hypothetical protein